MKTGIFSGSFNPIHIGHLALANYLCEFAGLDEVWFVVSPLNPLKDEADLLDNDLRLEMVSLAIGNYPKFKASDFEFTLPRPSYTVQTLRLLKDQYPDREFHLIIGADNWQQFHLWKEYETILNTTQILVYPRPGYEVQENKLPHTIKVVKAPLLDISSTFIRQSLQTGKDISFFLPREVYQYIKEKQLYVNRY